MTIGQKLNQTVASLESAAANLKGFALDTQDKGAQQLFKDLTGQVESVANSLQKRIDYVEKQEPQYKS